MNDGVERGEPRESRVGDVEIQQIAHRELYTGFDASSSMKVSAYLVATRP